MKHITSVQNDIVKKIVTLNTSKGRTLHKEYLAEGLRTLERFAAAQKMPKELYVVESLYTDAKILFPSADVTVVTDHVMKRISSLMTPPGILGVFDLPSESLQNEVGTGNQSGLVLVDISDPGNMGALIRSMVACGYKKIYVIGGVDPFSPKVIQASAGTIACVDVIECAWQELVDANGRSPLAAMVVTGGDALTKLDAQNLLFVLGNEAHGLPQSVVDQCEFKISLPMDQAAESFNVAVAGSIGLFLFKNKALL